jgi:SAM-dependent methyltransferase
VNGERETSASGQQIAGFYERFSLDVGLRDWRLANPRHVQLRLLADEVLSRPNATRRILDVGCGAGVMSRYLRRFGEVTGVDHSEPAIALARRLLPDVRFIAGSLLDASLPPASFDIITLFDVAEHIPRADRQSFLHEVGRLAAGDAMLLLSTPHPHLSEWMHHERPDLMQVVDEPVPLTRLIEAFEPQGFTLTRYVTFDIERTGPQYQFAVFRRGLVAGRESQSVPEVRRRVRALHHRLVRKTILPAAAAYAAGRGQRGVVWRLLRPRRP